MTKDECLSVIGQSFMAVASEANITAPADVGEDTPLVGPSSQLDSMALVSLVLDVEQRLEEEHGLTVSLMDERALSRKRSPFRSVGTLADYIVESIDQSAEQ
jgi:acyl carrier protein